MKPKINFNSSGNSYSIKYVFNLLSTPAGNTYVNPAGQNYTINSAATNLVGGVTRTGTVATGATTAIGTAAQNVVLNSAATNLGTTNVRFGSGNAYTTTTTGAVPAGYASYTTGGNVGAVSTTVTRPAEYTSYSTGGQGYSSYTTGGQGVQYVQGAPQTYTTTQGIHSINSVATAPVTKVVQYETQNVQPITVSQVQKVETGVVNNEVIE